ncbi:MULTISPECIES: YggL family protein [Vibrio]|uniref:YggL 50S ribosome-binding family protein n=1 Tax=Vibrio TaxID=662 RepID=UPI001A8E8D31|nr:MULTISPECIES: 50S ribosome-binding protein YggL [Vibrio]ELA8468994.1 YggL family protein [Vibrio alginolyticus]ELB2848730.1 YggL family protein [Vibrio alginolyticus]MBO0198699.1 YggL family protein [Vibrio alginolyticus]MBS9973852.1 YggL family protein [Vibrio alginolyticus]MBT0020021.1 YggL family protein [Vibrio alginolyticus]
MKLDKIDNKSRRIRKKLFLGEFAILGFEISCETDINDFDRYDAFVDDFIDYIDELGLCFGGGGLELFEGFLCSTNRYGSATKEQKAQVIKWLEARPEVKSAQAGELVDANYL